MILYLLFLCGVLCYRWDWLVGAAFGTAMLFSSVTSIHVIVIAATGNPLYWDPDSVPATNVVFYSLLAATLLVMWSSSFRKATKDTKVLVLLWSLIMIAGLISSFIYIDTPLYRVFSDEICNEEIPPLRRGESSIALFWTLAPIEIGFNDILVLKTLFPTQILLAFYCAISSMTPTALVERFCGPWPAYRFWRVLLLTLIFALEIFFVPLVLYYIGVSEYLMLVRDGWVSAEQWSAVGQWGQACNTVFTFGAAAVVSLCKGRKDPKESPRPPGTEQTLMV